MFIDIEATGCPNACRHCGVDGRPPWGELYSLEELRGVAAEWGGLIYLHEPTAHPAFPEILDPEIASDYAGYLPTCGFGIAQRDDYASVLARMRDLGFHTLSFALHGLREHHDWFAARRGAFDDIVVATQRAVNAGLKAGWQIFVDRQGLDDIPALVGMAIEETGQPPSLSIPYHRISPRMWRYERLRPTLEDIRDRGLDRMVDDPKRNRLTDPEALTGAAWLEKWKRSTDMKGFELPFEPSTWPPEPPFKWLAIHILRDRSVYLDPTCARPIRLGSLTDGKEALLQRLRGVQAPAHVDVAPGDVELTPTESVELHPAGYSLRGKMIAKKLWAGPGGSVSCRRHD